MPANEVLIKDFKTADWSYYMTSAQTMGVNIVIWVHDPQDFDKRAEVTLVGGFATLAKGAGWNAHQFRTTQGGMFYYGEGTTGSGLTAGTQYLWSQFQADNIFGGWTIYRVTIEMGWEATGTFDQVFEIFAKFFLSHRFYFYIASP